MMLLLWFTCGDDVLDIDEFDGDVRKVDDYCYGDDDTGEDDEQSDARIHVHII